MSGPGPRIVVNPPLHQPPVISLLNAADIMPPLAGNPAPGQWTDARPGWPSEVGERALPDRAVQGVSAIPPEGQWPDRWLNGVTYEPEKCGGGGTIYMGSPIGGAWASQTKSIAANAAAVVSDPFIVYAGDSCSSFGWEARDYVGRATRLLATCEPKLVEQEFWTGTQAKLALAAGVDYSQTQFLAQNTTAITLNAGAAVDPVRALSWLYNALSDCSCGTQAMLHIPRAILPFMWGDYQLRRDGSRILDMLDNVVVPGVGYSAGTGPDGSSPATGTAWMYATTVPRIWRGEVTVLPGSYAEAMNRATNTISFLAERPYLVDWDRCCHYAIRVNLIDP